MSAALEYFKEITGYDLGKFFSDYITFTSKYYSNIVNYYSGQDIDQDSFNYFDKLVAESGKIKELWELNANSFKLTDFWELMDTYSNIDVKLSTINNLGRWLRSSRGDRYSSNTTISYVQKQGESLERIALKSGGDVGNDWIDLAISNDLHEEAYSSTGGVLLQVKLKNNLNFDFKNIVDTLSPINVYGKDIKNKIEFVDGDIVCLFGEESLMQTIQNIMDTEKGFIPEFPIDGTDPNLIGSNVSFFNYPAQFRHILNMIQKDDRFKSFDLLDLQKRDDIVFMKFQIKTKIGSVIQQELAI